MQQPPPYLCFAKRATLEPRLACSDSKCVADDPWPNASHTASSRHSAPNKHMGSRGLRLFSFFSSYLQHPGHNALATMRPDVSVNLDLGQLEPQTFRPWGNFAPTPSDMLAGPWLLAQSTSVGENSPTTSPDFRRATHTFPSGIPFYRASPSLVRSGLPDLAAFPCLRPCAGGMLQPQLPCLRPRAGWMLPQSVRQVQLARFSNRCASRLRRAPSPLLQRTHRAHHQHPP